MKTSRNEIVISNYKICSSWLEKTRGLMFRGSDFKTPLLFVFKKPTRTPIHSFFVRFPFIAVWLLNGKIVDKMLVEPWKSAVVPRSKFDMLLEIPTKFL